MFESLALPRGPGHLAVRLDEPAREGGIRMDVRIEAGASSLGSPSNRPLPTLTPHVKTFEGDIEQILLSSDEIQRKIAETGEQLTRDYAGKDLLLVGVLKGAFVFMADLSRHINLPLEFDFMAVSSYGAATQTSGVVRILKDLDHEINGRHVLVVEDIVDSGLTLSYLLKNLRTRKPATLEVCALMQKTGVQRVPLDIKYKLFEIPSVFVVGYGLDFSERFRNVPYVGTLRPEVYRDAVS
jgi:hypoxanthine phosphoribosyltransferase